LNVLNPHKKIVFFDGVCHLCNGSVDFLIRKNKILSLFFSPLQSGFAKDRLKEFHNGEFPMESILFLRGDRLFKESRAALEICKELAFPWNLLASLLIIPSFIRDKLYRWIAKNRYNWFGREKECMIPNKEVSQRFLF
jgi:predicted DCC family thiol-disulfide oxidoreductase YuxK